jgi:hypothetical protein
MVFMSDIIQGIFGLETNLGAPASLPASKWSEGSIRSERKGKQ